MAYLISYKFLYVNYLSDKLLISSEFVFCNSTSWSLYVPFEHRSRSNIFSVQVVFKVRTCVIEEVNTARLKVKFDSLEQCIYNNYVFPLVVLNYSYM